MRAIASPVFAAMVLLSLFLPLTVAAQEGSWLDGDLASWNTPGMTIPAAPPANAALDPRCTERERPADTALDAAVMAEGWRLFLPYQRGWGVTLIPALSDYDGMCRPLGYQYFVFVGDAFAGTIAPEPMNSRFDGAADDVNLWFKDQLSAEFRRYTANDPLCCPSGSASVQYTIDETPDGPALNPVPTSQRAFLSDRGRAPRSTKYHNAIPTPHQGIPSPPDAGNCGHSQRTAGSGSPLPAHSDKER